ncbi:TetR family transcriptional regulator [Nocardia sp. NPDC051030]|uniref:TetR family transcriptional regulator n=1 Tax=Nocardia sp. NPDC051030 TaxID=3155162 RepID=UPI003439A202
MTGRGLRERKKAQTRKRLAEVAFRLFQERGFDGVTVAEIADASDVAVSTLFSYFPSKEALVFDQDDDLENSLIAAVRNRSRDVSIIDALETHLSAPRPKAADGPTPADFTALVNTTPALQEYADRMHRRWERSLATAIAEEAQLPPGDPAATALARFALDTRLLAGMNPSPETSLRAIFDRLRHGWSDFGR